MDVRSRIGAALIGLLAAAMSPPAAADTQQTLTSPWSLHEARAGTTCASSVVVPVCIATSSADADGEMSADVAFDSGHGGALPHRHDEQAGALAAVGTLHRLVNAQSRVSYRLELLLHATDRHAAIEMGDMRLARVLEVEAHHRRCGRCSVTRLMGLPDEAGPISFTVPLATDEFGSIPAGEVDLRVTMRTSVVAEVGYLSDRVPNLPRDRGQCEEGRPPPPYAVCLVLQRTDQRTAVQGEAGSSFAAMLRAIHVTTG